VYLGVPDGCPISYLPSVVVKESVLDVILYNLAREEDKGEDRVVPILDSCFYIIRTSVTDTRTSHALRSSHVCRRFALTGYGSHSRMLANHT
jgi:hypothetical protein